MDSTTWTKAFRQLVMACAACVGTLAAGPATSAAMTAIDSFIITRSGVANAVGTYQGQSIFYSDTFSDGAVPPDGGSFFTGQTGSYAVLGRYADGAEAGGTLALNSALGGPFVNANGADRTLQRSVLQTDTNAATPAGLKQAFHTFAEYGLFDLTIPPLAGDGYGILLSDAGPGGSTKSFDLFVRREGDGSLVIRFQEQDFLGGQVHTFELDPLLMPQGADQIELRMKRADIATNTITAGYRYWGSGAPMGAFVDMETTGEFFTTNGSARGGFFAVQAYVTPEPGAASLGLLAAVAAVAASMAGRRRRRVG